MALVMGKHGDIEGLRACCGVGTDDLDSAQHGALFL
jgi:hypothetical protein